MRTKRNPFRASAPDKSVASKMFTVGAEAANVISVTIQLKDARAKNLTGPRAIRVFLSDSATTGAIIATAPSGGVAAGGGIGSILNAAVAGKVLDCMTNATGALRLDITEAGVKTLYVYLVTPNGEVAVSPAVTFA